MRSALLAALLVLATATPAPAQVQRDPHSGATSTGPWSGANTPPPGGPVYRPVEGTPLPRSTPLPAPTPLGGRTPRPQPSFHHYVPPAATPTPMIKQAPKAHATAAPKAAPVSFHYPPALPPGWAYSKPRASTVAAHGAVACVNGEASRVGVKIMAAGGNAVDAAIAVAFALAVVYPVAGNLGGGGFMLVRTGGRTAALDFRETAPARARRTMFLDKSGNPTEASRVGALSVGIPGTVAGLEAVHKRYGKLPWRTLVAPAIALATNGFVVNDNLAGAYRTANDTLLRYDETRRVMFLKGHFPQVGDRLRQPDLARTLQRIATAGARGFYEGPVAAAIAHDQKAHGGLITTRDLASYKPVWRTPVSFTYRGYTVASMPPPSSGGVGLAEILNVLEGVKLRELGWQTPAHLHWLVESQRRSFVDRNAYLGDPAFVHHQPIATLTSKAYAAKLRAGIPPNRAKLTRELTPGLGEKEETTQFSVIDSAGNAVSCTYTLNGLFGSGMVAAHTGVFLNDEMDDFAARPGRPNQFGLVQGEKNAVGPGKRPLSSMSPTIVLDPRGKLFMSLGSPGGPTIITTVAQVLSNVIDYQLPLNLAIAAPRVHAQDRPDFMFYEANGMTTPQREGLVKMGHQVKQRVAIGDAMGVMVRPDGRLEAFADPRHGGEAAGY